MSDMLDARAGLCVSGCVTLAAAVGTVFTWYMLWDLLPLGEALINISY